MYLLKRSFIFSIYLYLFCLSAFSQTANIPLDSRIGTPANDLVYNNTVLRSEQARELESTKYTGFLSELNPFVERSGVWVNSLGASLDKADDSLAVSEGDIVDYQDIVKSNRGFFKFSVLNKNKEFTTLYLDKKLHTTLLRKNLLRKLGYIVPAIKYLPSINLRFKSVNQKEFFLTKMLRGTEGRTSRWVVENNPESLIIKLRDLAAQDLSDGVLYNFALGLPSGDLNTRATRSLIIPYSLVNVKESVNKLSWHLGRFSEGEKLSLEHFVVNNNFHNTTYNDVLWVASRMSKLTREDYTQIVKNSFFPIEVEKILIEKLISRAKYLFDLLEIDYNKSQYDFNPTISYGKDLRNGKLKKVDWTDDGYASEFAAGDKESPFKDFEFYIYSIFQSVGIDSLVARANEELSLFDPNQARFDLAKKEFYDGLDHFVETGEFIEFPISTWSTPIVDGNIILSRDIVIGNYMGSENTVQFADTFGYSVSLGGMLGVENVDLVDLVSFSATARYIKTYTHLKPLKSLKDVFKEDYRNMFVPILKKNLRKVLLKASKNFDESDGAYTAEEEQTYYSEVIKNISKILNVGESLIITEKINPTIGGKVKVPLMDSAASVSLGTSYNDTRVKRLQILRKDAKTIQVYDDRGYGNGFEYTLSLNYLLPIVRFESKPFEGAYNVNSYIVNLDIDPASNPDFISSVIGLEKVMNTGDTEILEDLSSQKSNVSTAKLKSRFKDKYDKFAFLFWRKESNRGFAHLSVDTSSSLAGDYVTYHDTERTGMNWESFVKDIIQYGLSKLSVADDVRWANRIWGNPSNSIIGSSKSLESSYEAQLLEKKVAAEYMSFAYRYEGWSEGRDDLIEIMNNLNKKFTVDLFSKTQVQTISSLYMYDIVAKVNLYKNGVRALKSISREHLIRFANHYDSIESHKGRGCPEKRIKSYRLNVNNKRVTLETCGTLRKAISNINKCEEYSLMSEQTKCWVNVGKDIFKSTPFSYFSTLVGEKNYYLAGQVNGFRMHNEVLFEPIKSNSFGYKHPKYPFGIIQKVETRTGIQSGEFNGEWLRENP